MRLKSPSSGIWVDVTCCFNARAPTDRPQPWVIYRTVKLYPFIYHPDHCELAFQNGVTKLYSWWTNDIYYDDIMGPIDDWNISYSASWTSLELCSQRIRLANSGKKRGKFLLKQFFSRLPNNCITWRTSEVLASSSSFLAVPIGTWCKAGSLPEASLDGSCPAQVRYIRNMFSQTSIMCGSTFILPDKDGLSWNRACRSLR